MEHLTLETLARLVDEAPDTAEAAHLAVCDACREELAALREDVAALAEMPDLLPPPADAWPRLEARLREEGLIGASPAPERRSTGGRWLRAAAAALLFLLGGASGFAVKARTGGGQVAAEPMSGDAVLALEAAEAAYLAALARYAELAETGPDDDPRTRLAALEEIVTATREALTAAPADPVINGYHLTALAQREATLRRLAHNTAGRWY